MRATTVHLEQFRVQHPARGWGAGMNGAFVVQGPRRSLTCMVSDGAGWEHVSVSCTFAHHRVPTWEEMVFVKDLFWEPDEAVMQLHPPEDVYVHHGGAPDVEVLHLWRPIGREIPMPPLEFV